MRGRLINSLIGVMLTGILGICSWSLHKLISVNEKLVAVETQLVQAESKPQAPQWLIEKVKRLEARIEALEKGNGP